MPPLAKNCVRGKGSSGVQSLRSASQVSMHVLSTERGRGFSSLKRDASDAHPPSSCTLSIMVKLFGCSRRLTRPFIS